MENIELKNELIRRLKIKGELSSEAIEKNMKILINMLINYPRSNVIKSIDEKLIRDYDEYAKDVNIQSIQDILKRNGKTLEYLYDLLKENKVDDSYNRKINDPIYRDDEFVRIINENRKENKNNVIEFPVVIPKYKVQKDRKIKQAKGLHINKTKFISIVVAGVVIFLSAEYALNTNKLQQTQLSKNIVQTQENYSFKYIVEAGDTLSGLKDRFNAYDIGHSDSNILNMGEVVTIHTYDINMAKEGEALFEQKQKEKEPISFETYVVKPGDTLPEIADMFGVTCDDIMKYNSQIEDIRTIYAGDTYKIPQWNKTNSLNN